MKILENITIRNLLAIVVLFLAACDSKEIGPKLPDPATFVAPSWISPSTSNPAEFTVETVADKYETFTWQNTDYGIKVSVAYEIQVSVDEDFTDSKTMITVNGTGVNSARSQDVTVKVANDAALALGLPAGSKSTIYLRVKSTFLGAPNDPLYSGAISREVTPFRTSDCGNFCSIGLIGDFTNWSDDVDMHLLDPTRVDKYTWTVTTYLTTGGVKFRANDAWDSNWGASAFPSGTGTQDGSNISVPADGYYKVIFNDATGAYTFTEVGTSTFASIGIIGDQTAWVNDIGDLTQDAGDPHVWTGTISLTAGKLKFRAEDGWDKNWGSATYPSGFGTGGGPDIVIPVDATYFIYFNDASGEYFFGPAANSSPFGSIGLIGDATPDGWNSDVDLIKDPLNPYKWSKKITIVDGGAKFRADNDWAVNWGASTFPGGIGVQNGGNIAAQAGTYFVTFNTLTGEYYFLK